MNGVVRPRFAPTYVGDYNQVAADVSPRTLDRFARLLEFIGSMLLRRGAQILLTSAATGRDHRFANGRSDCFRTGIFLKRRVNCVRESSTANRSRLDAPTNPTQSVCSLM